MDNSFLTTSFSYSYVSVGRFDLNVTGYINAVKIKDDVLTALFKKPIEDPYLIHALCDLNRMVYISRYDKNGFDLKSLIENDPIKYFNHVMAFIKPYK